MKSTDKNIGLYDIDFNGENPLISEQGEMLTDGLKDWIKKIDSIGNTVIITDPYLFHSDNKEKYKTEIKNVLLSLKAKKIIWISSKNPKDLILENDVKTLLSENQCDYERKNIKEHDRYWICVEKNKGFVMGTSANGFEKYTTYILEQPEDDVKKLLAKWKVCGGV